MKLKYYLRGIGIGIVVTSVVFMVGGSVKQTMSDEEVIARAKELGLVENTVLSEWGTESQVSPFEDTEKATEEAEKFADEEQVKEQESSETDLQSSSEKESEPVSEDNSEERNEEMSGGQTEELSEEQDSSEASAEYITIEIVSGDSSWSVSQKAYDAGLVSSVSEFDAYLCANGYDRSLSVGQHKVRSGSDMKAIADALSGR